MSSERNDNLWSLVTNQRAPTLPAAPTGYCLVLDSSTLSTVLEMISSAMRHATSRCRFNPKFWWT